MKVAICGSRVFTNYPIFEEHILEWEKQNGKISLVISGGAVGADKLAEIFAKKYNRQTLIIPPDYSKYPPRIAPLERNSLIIQEADYLIAFPTKESKGTWDTVNKAIKKGIQIKIYQV